MYATLDCLNRQPGDGRIDVGVCSSAEKFVNDQDLDQAIRKVLETLDGVENVSAEQKDGIVNFIRSDDVLAVVPKGLGLNCRIPCHSKTHLESVATRLRSYTARMLSGQVPTWLRGYGATQLRSLVAWRRLGDLGST